LQHDLTRVGINASAVPVSMFAFWVCCKASKDAVFFFFQMLDVPQCVAVWGEG